MLLVGEFGEGEGQDAGAEGYGFGGRVLVGAVRDAGAAGNEEHRNGSDAGDETGVVVGAGDHFLVGDGIRLADGFEGGDDMGIADGRGVGVDLLLGDGDMAAGFDGSNIGVEGGHDGVAAGDVGVAYVEHEGDAGGDGVDGAGVDGDRTDGGDRICGAGGRVGGEGVAFDGEGEFGGGAEGVAAVGHEEGPGVAAEAGDLVAVAGRGGDVGDDSEGNPFAFEKWALLDVELNPGVVVVGWEGDGGQ